MTSLFEHGNLSFKKTWVTLCISFQTRILATSPGVWCQDFMHNSIVCGFYLYCGAALNPKTKGNGVRFGPHRLRYEWLQTSRTGLNLDSWFVSLHDPQIVFLSPRLAKFASLMPMNAREVHRTEGKEHQMCWIRSTTSMYVYELGIRCEVGMGCLLQSMARQHMSNKKCNGWVMTWSSILGDNVLPCIQSRIDMSLKPLHFTTTWKPVYGSLPSYKLQ